MLLTALFLPYFPADRTFLLNSILTPGMVIPVELLQPVLSDVSIDLSR